MCKTYEAIYQLLDHVKSDILICSIGNAKIEGKLHKCESDLGKNKCYEDVITLEDATVHCHVLNQEKKFKWINIPSKEIKFFAFKCCEL